MTLLEHLREYLVANDVGRNPADQAADPALPTIWLMPRKGLVAPGEKPYKGSDWQIAPRATIGIFDAPGIAPTRYEGFLRRVGVDIRLRTVAAAPEKDQITYRLNELLNDQRGWTMNGILIQESLQYTPMQPLEADEHAWTFTSGWLFDVFESALSAA